ncbi:hypothetical protein DN824_17325 [Stutzerimonas nosocomialis]|nr:hypothetical protein DN824_17325 [Stutzerimonas nosocomialis]
MPHRRGAEWRSRRWRLSGLTGRSSRSRSSGLADPVIAHFSDLGVAYAVGPQSDAGIYWTALFGGS